MADKIPNEKLVVLDFSTGEIHIYPIVSDYEPEISELFKKLGHDIDSCQWMLTDGAFVVHENILLKDETD